MYGFCPLASGSKGNAIFIGTKSTRILIDAGMSASVLINRLNEIGIELDTIDAILITHEHSDHVAGLPALSQKGKFSVLANAETAKGIFNAYAIRPRFKIFTTGEPFVVGDLEIEPFSVPHDTLDPVAFTIRMSGLKMGFCADLGHATSLVKKHLERCDYLYLEANHQPSMVHSSNRPEYLKKRILGKQGHLSNQDCGELLGAIYHSGLKHVHLAHLSRECNTEEVALQTVRGILEREQKELPLAIAYQDKVSKSILF